MATSPPLAPRSPRGARRPLATAVVVLALGAVAVLIVREPWHGPILFSLSTGHGIDAGDVPVVAFVPPAVLIWRRWPPPRSPRLRPAVGAASAVVLGAVLVGGVAVGLTDRGTLVPSAGGTIDGTIRSVDGRSANPVGVWSYLALTYDGTTMTLFVDGRLVSAQPTSGSVAATPHPLWLGGNHPYGEYFDGLIDEARVYDRALDAEEIRSDMTSPVAAGRPGLVAAYSFDRAQGATLADDSGHGNAGTITGATWTRGGRFGGALRFNGDGDRVRIPASASLDMGSQLTLSAWVRPRVDQRGWRTVMHREQDDYFLMAGSGLEGATGWRDDLLVGVVLAAAAWQVVVTVASRGRWLGPRRRAWPVGAALFLAGCLLDVVCAPSGTLFAPALLAAWFAATASVRVQAIAGWLVTVALAAATLASLAHLTERGAIGAGLAKVDGGAARSAALGATLVVAGATLLWTEAHTRRAGGSVRSGARSAASPP